MRSFLKKHALTLISLATIAIICFVWWANGAEKEDAWLYASSIFIVAIPPLEAYLKRKKDQ